jgi:hypothetical protein
MAGLGLSNVQSGPFRVPVKRNALFCLVLVVQFLESLPLDRSRPVGVKESEGNLILGVGLRKQVLKGSPFVDVDSAGFAGIGDSEEDSVVFPFDLVL